MKTKIQGIILGRVRHSDRSDILALYTRRHGRMAFVVPALASRKRPSAVPLLPLTVVESWVTLREGRELSHLGSPSVAATYPDIYASPVKSAIALFLTDFLNHLLLYSEGDEQLYDFLVDAVCCLNALADPAAIANFPIVFLSLLMRYVGVTPDTSGYAPGMHFDLRAGAYAPFEPHHRDVLTGEAASLPALLADYDLSNLGTLSLGVAQRRDILHILLRYLSIHLPGLNNLRSLDILSTLFAD